MIFMQLLKLKQFTFLENRDLSIAKERLCFLIVIDHNIVISLERKNSSFHNVQFFNSSIMRHTLHLSLSSSTLWLTII